MDTLQALKIVKGIFAILDLFVWARVILSWIPHNQYNEITRTVYNVTEPLLRPIRDLIPASSPFVSSKISILNCLFSAHL